MDDFAAQHGPVPVCRAGLVVAQAKFLRGIGAPVDRGLQRNRLPGHIEESPQSWVTNYRSRMFTADMALREDLPTLGLRPEVTAFNNLNEGYRRAMLGAPTLLLALKRMASLSKVQNTASILWVEVDTSRVRSCTTFLWPHEAGHSIAEQITLSAMRSVISAYTGEQFVPQRILLQSRRRDMPFNLEIAYRGVTVLTDQPYGAIEFPRALLRTPSDYVDEGSDNSIHGPPTSLGGTLEAVLPTYFRDGYPSIEMASELVGCSGRTLQRKLRQEGSSYRRVVQSARFAAAKDFLQDPEMPLTAISALLGYSELSAFSRAFSAWTGCSPSEYRERH